MGMQKMKTSFDLNFTANTIKHCFEAESLSPVESPSIGTKRGLAAMPMVFGDNYIVGLVARREYG